VTISDGIDSRISIDESLAPFIAMPDGRVSTATAESWGLRETPAVLELDYGNRVNFFRQGHMAAIQFRAIRWQAPPEVTPQQPSPVR
jgi:hypothetical protein